jgi:hypothetical protein
VDLLFLAAGMMVTALLKVLIPQLLEMDLVDTTLLVSGAL